jgi:hypothetical protein
MTVKIGSCSSSSLLRNKLQRNQCQMNSHAHEILSVDTVIPTAPIKQTLNLKLLTLNKYGFSNGRYTINDVIKIGLQRGYGVCPGELAAQFRLQYRDQPLAPLVIFGMAPFGYRGFIWTFIITDNDEGHSLRAVHFNSQVLSMYPPGVQHAKDVMTVWVA